MKAYLITFCILLSFGSILAQTNASGRVLANEFYRNARILRSDKQFESSNALIRKSLPLFSESKMWGKYLSALETMAENFTDLENSDSTKYYWEKLAAESVKQIGKNNRYELVSYLALSDFYLANEQLTKSNSMIQSALELIKTKPLGREPFSVKVYTNQAIIFAARQEYPEAIQAFEQASKNADIKTVEPASSANLFKHYAITLLELGRAKEALEKAEKSLKLYNSVYTTEQKNKVEILLLISEIQIQGSNFEQAVIHNKEALRLSLQNPKLQIKALKQEAKILMLQNKNSESEASLLRAVNQAQQTYASKHAVIGEIYLDLAEVSLRNSAFAKAINYALKGQEALEFNKIINLSAICYLKLLNAELKAERLSNVLNLKSFEKKILDFYELMNRQQFSLSSEKELRSVSKNLFENLIDANFDKNPERAFYWADFYKIICKRSLLHIEEPKKQVWTLKDSTLSNIYALKLQKLQLFHELEKALENRNSILSSKLVELLKNYDDKIAIALELLKKNQPDFYKDFFAFEIPTVKVVSENLRKDALLYYFEAQSTYFCFILQNNKLSTKRIDKKQVDKEIDVLLKQIAQKSKKINSDNISKLILPTLGQTANLVIVPDGKIWNLPFELLVENNTMLLEKYAVRYVWSYSDLLRKAKSKGKDLCFFSTNYKKQPNNKFPRHQASYKEARNWSKNLNINNFRRYFYGDFEYNQQASESNFLAKNISEFSLLHLAYFMDRDASNPMNSAILMHFQQDSISDAVLHLNELSAISLPLSLISLANFSDSSGFDEVMACYLLAFEATGAESVLYSAWAVENDLMSKLMQQYYKNLAAGMTKSEALRKAKLTFKDKAPHLWASLRLYGQDGLVALRTKFRFPWLWVGISAAILIIGILLFLRFRKAES